MIRIAMIGCGDISGIYLKNLTHVFKEVELIGVCDLIPERAKRAQDYVRSEVEQGADRPVPVIYRDMYEAFEDPEVQVILNLTRPAEHFDVSEKALLAGKSVYSEKPLGITMEEGRRLTQLAEEKDLYLGGAPDTFMGAGIQTARMLIDKGIIGDVVGANVSMICHGHETWHPDPEFYYKAGGGPMLDMGPYYMTALVNLIGEARAVTAMTKRSFPTRLISSQPHSGETIQVDVDTYQAGNILFANGAIASVLVTFDVFYKKQDRFEIYGTKGTLIVPDPNTFGGPLLLYRPEDDEPGPATDPGYMKKTVDFYPGYKEIPLMYDYRENSRGLGLADMCKAMEEKRVWRANYHQQLHVLELMTAFSKASESGECIKLSTRFERADAMKNNPLHGILD